MPYVYLFYLQVYNKTSEKYSYVQIGIVSFGYGCGNTYIGKQKRFEGIYSKVSSQIDWIKKHIMEGNI